MTNTNLPKRFTKKPVTIEATYSPESAALAQSGQGEVLGFAWRAKGSSDKWKFCGDIKQRPDLSQEADAKRFVNTEIVDLFTRPQPAQPSSEDVRELTKWLNEESTAPINKQALARVLAAQPARVVGTVTGYQTASGAQQWQFNPSNVAGLENQRFDVALSTSTAAPTICGMPVVIDESMPADQFKFVQPAPTPSQAAVTEMVDSLSNVEKEYELLAAMRNIELRRPRRSFGIRVMSDELAVEWQVLDKRLDGLIDARRRTLSAYAKKAGA